MVPQQPVSAPTPVVEPTPVVAPAPVAPEPVNNGNVLLAESIVPDQLELSKLSEDAVVEQPVEAVAPQVEEAVPLISVIPEEQPQVVQAAAVVQPVAPEMVQPVVETVPQAVVQPVAPAEQPVVVQPVAPPVATQEVALPVVNPIAPQPVPVVQAPVAQG